MALRGFFYGIYYDRVQQSVALLRLLTALSWHEEEGFAVRMSRGSDEGADRAGSSARYNQE